MITKFQYIGLTKPQQFPVLPAMPVVDIRGVGPGYASVVFGAVPYKSGNDENYVVGG